MKIFKFSLRRILTDKIRLGIIVLLPLMFVVMFVLSSYNTINIGIVDNDKTELTKSIIEEMSNNKFYRITVFDEDDLKRDIITYQVDYGFILEENFTEDFLNNKEFSLNDYYFIESVNVNNAKIYLESYLNNVKKIIESTNGQSEEFYQVLSDFNTSQIKLSNLSDNDTRIQKTISAIGFTVYFLIFLQAITCGIIIEDKKNGTLGRIFNTPVTIKKYLFESLLSYIVIAVIQITILMLTFKYAFNFYFDSGFFSILLLLIFFGIASIAMGLLIVSIVKTPIQMYLTVGVVASPMAMLGGCYWPMDMMPIWLQNVGKLFPTSWVMTGTQEIIGGGNFLDIIDNLGILILFTVAFFIGGIIKKKDFAKA